MTDRTEWRLGQIERKLDQLQRDKADRDDLERVERAMGRLTAAFYTLSAGIVLAAVTFAFAVAQLH